MEPTQIGLLIGDLGPARRHIDRIRTGEIPATSMVLTEIAASVERCIMRLLAIEAAADISVHAVYTDIDASVADE